MRGGDPSGRGENEVSLWKLRETEGGDVSAKPSVAGGGVGDDKQPHYSHLNVSG